MGKAKPPETVSGSQILLGESLINCIVEVAPVEEEPRITKFNVQIKEVEKKLKSLIRSLDGLVVRTLGVAGSHCIRRFLLEVVDEFRVESRSRSRRDPFEVTLHDRLVVIRFLSQVVSTSYFTLYRQIEPAGTICWKIYKIIRRKGPVMDLNTIMVGINIFSQPITDDGDEGRSADPRREAGGGGEGREVQGGPTDQAAEEGGGPQDHGRPRSPLHHDVSHQIQAGSYVHLEHM